MYTKWTNNFVSSFLAFYTVGRETENCPLTRKKEKKSPRGLIVISTTGKREEHSPPHPHHLPCFISLKGEGWNTLPRPLQKLMPITGFPENESEKRGDIIFYIIFRFSSFSRWVVFSSKSSSIFSSGAAFGERIVDPFFFFFFLSPLPPTGIFASRINALERREGRTGAGLRFKSQFWKVEFLTKHIQEEFCAEIDVLFQCLAIVAVPEEGFS